MTNFKTDSLAVFFGALAGIVTLVTIGSIFTIMSINIIFKTNIPLNMETIFSITWLTMVAGGIMRGAKQ